MNVNKYICTGRLTKDPELRQVSEDMKVCQLRLAVDGMGRGREVDYVNAEFLTAPRPAQEPGRTPTQFGSRHAASANRWQPRPDAACAASRRRGQHLI